MLVVNRFKKILFTAALLLLAVFFVTKDVDAAGMSVGNNALNLAAGENIYYGLTSGTNADGNFLLFEKGAGNTVFKIDYAGNITTNGSVLGTNTSYWNASGNNLFASSTAWNVGIGTTAPGAYKLNVVGDTNINGVLTATTFSGTYSGTINASNVSAGNFAANTGLGNFSFPGNVGIGTTNPEDVLSVNGPSGVRIIGSGYAANLVFGSVDAWKSGIRTFDNGDAEMRIWHANAAGQIVLATGYNGDESSTMPTDGLFIDQNIVGIGYASPAGSTGKLLVNGNVGIGTVAPGTGLFVSKYNSNDLATNYNSTAAFNVNGSDVNLVLGGYGNGTNASIIQSRSGGNSSTIGAGNYLLLLNPLGGDVGIGKIPATALDVNGTVTATSFAGAYNGTIGAPNVSAGNFGANTGGGNYTFPGSVGIGTTNPTASLNTYFANGLWTPTHTRIGVLSDITDYGNLGTEVYAGKFVSAIGYTGGAAALNIYGVYASATNVLSPANAFAIYSAVGNNYFAGNVGIGTTAPDAKLRVEGLVSVNGEGNGVLVDSGAAAVARVGLMKYGGYEGMFIAGNATFLRLAHRTDTAAVYGGTPTIREDLVIDTSGNVGIGTINPTSAKLVINPGGLTYAIDAGGARIGPITSSLDTDAASVAYVKAVAAGTSTVPTVGYWTANGTDIKNANSGNVGIGAAASTAKLSIAGGDDGSMTGVLALTTAGGTNLKLGGNTNYSWIQSHASLPLYINELGNNVIMNSAGGNVGIGTTDPGAYKLNVNGNTNITGTLTATTFSGALSGTVSSANVSSGTFGANTGGGNYHFPGNVYTDANYGYGLVGVYDSTKYQGIFSMGSGWALAADGSGPGNLYGLAWTHTNAGGQSKAGLSHQLLVMENGLTKVALGSGIWTSGDVSAPNYLVTAGDGYGIKFWISDDYKISMGAGGLYQYGPVTDYSIKTQMDASPGRGFTWGRNGIAPIAALNATSGNMQIAGTMTAASFSGPMAGTLSSANVSAGTFGSNTGGGTYSFGGVTTNGVSHFQWDGATYYAPGDYSPMLNVRQDNATTGLNGFKTALTLYNANGAQNTTVGLDFASAEGAGGTGNSVTLAGIMAVKESVGNVGGWSQGGLNFYVKNYGSRVDAMYINNGGNVGIGTASPGTKLDVQGGYIKANDAGGSAAFMQGAAGISYFGALGANRASFGNSENYETLVADGGNVGIGTTNPGTTLEVASSNDGILNLKQLGLGGTAGVQNGGWNYIQFLDSEGDRQGYFGIDSAGNFNFAPEVSGSNVTINSSAAIVGNLLLAGNIMRTSHSNGFLLGSYNNLGANDSKSNPIYTIGSAYVPGDTTLGDMYGIGYSHSNFWGAGKSTGWGLYTSESGVIHNTISESGIWTSGTITAASFSGTYSGTINSANVSAGAFGSNTGGGNYSFPGNVTVTGGIQSSDLSRIYSPGGASYTTQTSVVTGAFKIKLPNGSTGKFPMLQFTVNIYSYSTGKTSQIRVGGHFSTADWYNVFAYGMTDNASNYTVRYGRDDSGSMCVWIGELASTWDYPQVFVTDFQNGFSALDSSWASGWSIAPVTSFDTVTTSRVVSLGLNTNNYSSYALPLTGGTVTGGVTISGNLIMSGTANVSGINKITVNTVDPLYNIFGTNYSSFAPSIVGGVKEEVVGKINLDTKVGNEYQAIINFDTQTKGSDLWVWHNVIDFNKDNVEAVITPYGGFANTYYYINGNSLIFKSDRPVEISYRLLAKRFDWQKWPTLATDQTEKAGLIIK